ncbi:MAG: NADH-quinone oxidoreductase subunit E [Anaerolineaceae bacterium 4572_32.1]|nr:MAG: NADH-quinone oxidoreductase subunit E [Anaerolineaceae bacterium 4572_32.1]
MVERYGTEPASAVPILLGLQETFGYLPMEALRYVTEKTDTTPDQVYGVATFYGQFRMTPVGEHMVRVCHGTACHVRGAVNISQTLEEVLGLEKGQDTTSDNKYTVEKVACLGCCSLSPVIMIDDKVYGRLDRKKVRKIFKRLEREEAKK